MQRRCKGQLKKCRRELYVIIRIDMVAYDRLNHMKATTLASIFLPAAAAGLTLLWNLRADSISSSARGIAVSDSTAAPIPERSYPPSDALEESVDSQSREPERNATDDPVEIRLAERHQEMTDRMYQTVGSSVVRYLAESGLAPSDSEEVARKYAEDFAECGLRAFQIEAERQSISVEELISHFREVVDFREVPAISSSEVVENASLVIDVPSVNANLFGCVASAVQRAGIPYRWRVTP